MQDDTIRGDWPTRDKAKKGSPSQSWIVEHSKIVRWLLRFLTPIAAAAAATAAGKGTRESKDETGWQERRPRASTH